MTIERAFSAFIKNRSVYCSPETLDVYQEHNGYFFRFLEETYDKPMSDLTFEEPPEDDNIFSDFIIYLRTRDRKIKNVTIRSYCRSVKVFLRFCYDEDYCRDYMHKVKLPTDDAAPKLPLLQDEAAKVDQALNRSTLEGLRDYCIVHLMLDCGLRSQEVRHLNIADVDAVRNVITIKVSKGNKSRFTLIPPFLVDALQSYLLQCGRLKGPVFLSLKKEGEPITENTIKQIFYRLKIKTGIERIRAHLLRHTFATSYLIGGGNLEFLRVYMGHANYDVTQNYSHLAAECKMLGVDVYHLDPIFFTRGYQVKTPRF